MTAPSASTRLDRQDPEAALVERLRQHDEDAYSTFVREQSGRLLSVARRILRNEDDARDAVQEAFLSAFRALPAFDGRSRLSTWLHRILVNAALMKLRARARRPEMPIDDLLPSFKADGHHAEPVSNWGSSVEDLLLQREVRARVRRAVDALPDSYRIVILLRDIEGLDTGETAAALGLSGNAVKIRLHRARQALARLIEPAIRG